MIDLDLSNNQLGELPIESMIRSAYQKSDVKEPCDPEKRPNNIRAMIRMVKLTVVNLENNLLESAPFELFQTTTLQTMRLAGNDSLVSPPQVCVCARVRERERESERERGRRGGRGK